MQDIKLPYRPIIYLIDDDELFSLSLVKGLQLSNYKVVSFTNAAEFLKNKLSNHAIILCDMRMPHLTGLDLQIAINKRDLDIPIIFISGESTANQAVKALKEGAADFLTKPFEFEELLKSLAKLAEEMNKKRAAQRHLQGLTKRERVTLDLVIQGFQNIYEL